MIKRKYPLLIFLTMGLSVISCKKVVEEQQKKAFLAVMTDSYWHVESYNEGTIDITEVFFGYNFKFEANGTVTGIRESNNVKGTWAGDIENYTISSEFPNAPDPLNRLNGLWKIIDTEVDYVKAEMSTDKGQILLRLRKS